MTFEQVTKELSATLAPATKLWNKELAAVSGTSDEDRYRDFLFRRDKYHRVTYAALAAVWVNVVSEAR